MKIFKRICVTCLASTLLISFLPTVSFATETQTNINDEIQDRQVISRKTISAAKCKSIYNSMKGYRSWGVEIAGIVVGTIGPLGGVASGMTYLATVIQETNYNNTKAAFYKGWKSGKGCVMVIYDNATPFIYAL